MLPSYNSLIGSKIQMVAFSIYPAYGPTARHLLIYRAFIFRSLIFSAVKEAQGYDDCASDSRSVAAGRGASNTIATSDSAFNRYYVMLLHILLETRLEIFMVCEMHANVLACNQTFFFLPTRLVRRGVANQTRS
jgi:hypothetical protein